MPFASSDKVERDNWESSRENVWGNPKRLCMQSSKSLRACLNAFIVCIVNELCERVRSGHQERTIEDLENEIREVNFFDS